MERIPGCRGFKFEKLCNLYNFLMRFPSGSLIIFIKKRLNILPEKQKVKEQKTEVPEKQEPKAAIDHFLVPVQEIISSEEAKVLFDKLKVKAEQLPKIFTTDPAVHYLNPKIGDIIKVTRNSVTAGTAIYYRIAVENEDYTIESEE